MSKILAFVNIRERIGAFIAPSLVERRDTAERAANTDALTGLPNYAAFDKARTAAEQDNALAFILFDLNNFGLVNKTAGHSAGNVLLCKYASILQTVAIRYKARVFRLGGDEFVIICSRPFADGIRDVAERRAEVIDFGSFTVSISGETGTTVEDADSRLQARKAERKARGGGFRYGGK